MSTTEELHNSSSCCLRSTLSEISLISRCSLLCHSITLPLRRTAAESMEQEHRAREQDTLPLKEQGTFEQEQGKSVSNRARHPTAQRARSAEHDVRWSVEARDNQVNE